jgi:serine-type D-Ala-D-Ala carboxypeptidase
MQLGHGRARNSVIYPVYGTVSGDYDVSTLPPPAVRTRTSWPDPAFERQDSQFARAFQILEQAVAARAFPGAAVAVAEGGRLLALRGFGRLTYDDGAAEVSADTVFDLASVTKVAATTAMAMLLYDAGQLDLELPVWKVLPEFAGEDPRRREITIRLLLAHSSGLPAYERLFQRARTRDELLRAALETPLVAAPGTRAEYSDIGFITLGAALERIAGETLERFCQANLFGPLGMARTGYCPPPRWKAGIPPTVDDREFRGRIIQGEVHDENASVMGGIAGHAGVFAPAADLAAFAQALLDSRAGRPGALFRRPTVFLFTERQATHPGTSRALGWDTPSQPSQSGQYLCQNSFGHLGYTGTSLWIDPKRGVSITLLTNRTWPDNRNQQIKEVRPRWHDAVVEALSCSA